MSLLACQGFDEILCGGLIARRAYILLRKPGSGKTTLGLHFLAVGAARGESTLFIILGESEELIHKNAKAVDIDLKNIAFLDLSTHPEFFDELESL